MLIPLTILIIYVKGQKIISTLSRFSEAEEKLYKDYDETVEKYIQTYLRVRSYIKLISLSMRSDT